MEVQCGAMSSLKKVEAKYDQDSCGGIPSKSKFNSSKAPWHFIMKYVDWYNSNIKWKIRNGERTSFLHDIWHINNSLHIHYPRLYSLSKEQNCSIKDINSETLSWIFQSKRPLQSWEANQWNEILPSTSDQIENSGSDYPTWTLNSNGSFSMASVKKALFSLNSVDVNHNNQLVFKNLWKSSILIKCKF